MQDYTFIESQFYGTARGAQEVARRRGWKGLGGGTLSLQATLAKLARERGAAVLWNADDSVTTYSVKGGKVRQRTADAGSDEARWLISRFRQAADRE